MEQTAHRDRRLSPVNTLRWSCWRRIADVHMSHAVRHAVAAAESASRRAKLRSTHNMIHGSTATAWDSSWIVPSRATCGARRPSISTGKPQCLWNQLNIQKRRLATVEPVLPFGEGE
jgi:hypothetical protein